MIRTAANQFVTSLLMKIQLLVKLSTPAKLQLPFDNFKYFANLYVRATGAGLDLPAGEKEGGRLTRSMEKSHSSPASPGVAECLYSTHVQMVASLRFFALATKAYNNKKDCTNQRKSYNNHKLLESNTCQGDTEVMIRRILFVAVLAALLLSSFGCNMISGFGKDISGAADTVEGWITKP